MADKEKEKSSKSKSSLDADFGDLIILLLVGIFLFNGLSSFVPEKLHQAPRNTFFGKVDSFIFGGRDFPPIHRGIGAQVENPEETDVYGEPGGDIVGTQSEGAKGVVVDGPVLIDGENWWKVDYESGQDGWVREADFGWPEDYNAIGTRVVNKSDGSMFFEPNFNLLGSKPLGSKGIITDGPVYKDGSWWWKVMYDDGKEGWVSEDVLGADTTPRSFVGGVVEWIIYSFKFFVAILSVILISALIYVVLMSSSVSSKMAKTIAPTTKVENKSGAPVKYVNRKWQQVIDHVQSENQSDWRLAILECDIILAEMLEKMGYVGENVGEILKGIEKSDFTSIDLAWEAHRMRNTIAHEGSDFLLSKRDAERIIGLYKKVFEEFKFI